MKAFRISPCFNRTLALAAGLVLSSSAALAQNLVLNGSFELGSGNLGGFATVNNGAAGIDNWLVTGHSVDYIGSYWEAADGSRSVDLAGNGLGGVQQSFATTAGTLYTVSFALSGNNDGAPTLKTASVQVLNSSAAELYSNLFDFDTTGISKTAMGWTTYLFTFTANSATSLLSFGAYNRDASSPGTFGPALDNVSVTAIPEPSTIGLWLGSVLFAAVAIVRRRKA